MKNFGILVCIIHLIIGTLVPPPTFAASPHPLLSKLKSSTNNQLIVSFHKKTGYTRFLWVKHKQSLSGSRKTPLMGSPIDSARSLLSEYAPLFGVTDQKNELILKRKKKTREGRHVLKFQQKHQGLPVFAGEIVVRQDRYQNVLSLNGETAPDIQIDSIPTLTNDIASQTALTLIAQQYHLDPVQLQTTPPELLIYNPALIGLEPNSNQLAWSLEVIGPPTLVLREAVLVDAHSGQILLHYSRIDTALNRIIYDNQDTSSSLPGTGPARIEGGAAVSEEDVNFAYDYSGDTYNFYWDTHGRDSLDDKGMTIISTVRFPGNNAYWDTRLKQMVYGLGFPQADDIVAHELTHGVTEYESNLLYYMQSGAINESFSDAWGEFVDLTNLSGNDSQNVRWLIGEDLLSGEIRDMGNPLSFGDPDKMSSSHYYCGNSDSGGVHTNSGVNNKAVSLMTDGGIFNGQTVSGIGLSKTAKIYYEVQNTILTSGSDYADLYDALNLACSTLVGTAGITESDCLEVKKSIDAVEMNLSPQACTIVDAPLCEIGSANDIFFDNFENSGEKWTHETILGTDKWDTHASGWSKSGQYSLFNESNSATSDTFARMVNSVLIPTGAYFHYNQAFTFQNGQDGGVIEFSTDEGSSWSDAGAFITDNGYKAILNSASGNPIGGRNSFTGESFGYFSTKLDLSSLAGQSVMFRFRIGTDNSISYWPGWTIDDVRIYTCNPNETVQFSSAGMTVDESYGTVSIQVSRTGGSSGDLSVKCSSNDGTALTGSDYTAPTETLTWLAGDNSSRTCSFSIIDDNIVEGNEKFSMDLHSLTGSATIGNPSSAAITIEDNDFYGLLQFSKPVYDIDEAGGSITVEVSRANGSSGAVSAHCLVSNGTAKIGSDYSAVSDQLLTWAAGNDTNKFCTVTILDDNQIEGNESILVTLANPAGGVGIGENFSASITILDNSELQNLTTLFIGGHALNGAMFTIVSQKIVSIEGFSVNSLKAAGELFYAEVYYKKDGYVGFEGNPNAWISAGKTADIVSSGPGLPTLIPVPVHVKIPEGQIYAFYITTTDGSELRMTLGTSEGAVTASNDAIQVFEGVMSVYPFGTHYSPFIWNGTIHYYEAVDLVNCSGDSVLVENITFESGKTYECRATTSLSVSNGVTLEPGSDVTFTAPSVRITPLFMALPSFHIKTP